MKRNKLRLTKKHQEHVDQNKPQVLRGTPLNHPSVVEIKYRAKMDALIQQMTRTTQRRIEALFKSPTGKDYFEAMDATIASQAKILMGELTRNFEQLFNRKARPLAESMVNGADKASKTALHASLKELSGGMSLKTSMITAPMKQVLSASIQENVSLIKSIPRQYFTQIEGAVMRSITTGNGMQDLIPFFEKQKGITERRARLIASDQTRKAFNNFNTGRLKASGVKSYEWLHSAGDREPRPLHVQMSGNIYSYDDPPVIQYATGSLPEVRGKPGDLINCTCKAIPVITFGDDENAP